MEKTLTLTLKIHENDIKNVMQLLQFDKPLCKTLMTSFFVQGMISSAVGKLLGDGAVYREQETEYFESISPGDELNLTVEIAEIQEKRVFTLAKIKTLCKNQHGKIVSLGMATGIPPKENN